MKANFFKSNPLGAVGALRLLQPDRTINTVAARYHIGQPLQVKRRRKNGLPASEAAIREKGLDVPSASGIIPTRRKARPEVSEPEH